MNQGTYPLAAAMINQINRLDLISNNLANSNTHGFKQEGLSEGSFNNYLAKAEKNNFQPSHINTVLNTIPKIDSKYINNSQGPVTPTSNNLDFALIQKDVFFKIRGEDGEVLLTRDGAFHKLDGLLVNGSGMEVLNADGDPIATEEGFGVFVAVAKTDYTNLDRIGNNTYRILDIEKVENIDENEEYVLQSSIEGSNVNSVHTMVSLIEAHRRFAQSQKAIESIGEMSKTLIDKLGRG